MPYNQQNCSIFTLNAIFNINTIQQMAKKKNMFLVSLTPYLDKAIKDIAEKTGESQASVVREAIRDKLEKIGYVVKKS